MDKSGQATAEWPSIRAFVYLRHRTPGSHDAQWPKQLLATTSWGDPAHFWTTRLSLMRTLLPGTLKF